MKLIYVDLSGYTVGDDDTVDTVSNDSKNLWELNRGDTLNHLGSVKVFQEYRPMKTTQELADTVADGDRNWHKAVFTDGTEMSVLPQEWAQRVGE